MNSTLLNLGMKSLKGLFEKQKLKQIIVTMKDGEIDTELVENEKDIYYKLEDAKPIIIKQMIENKKNEKQ